MATLYQCDGCDHQTRDRSDFGKVELFQRDEDSLETTRDFDLCRMCFKRFQANLPNMWARNKGA